MAGSPFHQTLYGWIHLCEQRRIEGLMRDAESLQLAKRIAFSFHEPKRLDDERQDLMLRISPEPPAGEVIARGVKMIAELNKIDARSAELEARDHAD